MTKLFVIILLSSLSTNLFAAKCKAITYYPELEMSLFELNVGESMSISYKRDKEYFFTFIKTQVPDTYIAYLYSKGVSQGNGSSSVRMHLNKPKKIKISKNKRLFFKKNTM